VVTLFDQGRGFYVTMPGGSSYHAWAHVQSILSEKKFNVHFTDVSEKVGVLSVQGPNRWVHLFTVT
jgi:sarcosine dehydrogenase